MKGKGVIFDDERGLGGGGAVSVFLFAKKLHAQARCSMYFYYTRTSDESAAHWPCPRAIHPVEAFRRSNKKTKKQNKVDWVCSCQQQQQQGKRKPPPLCSSTKRIEA